jgi:hypothetical protein
VIEGSDAVNPDMGCEDPERERGVGGLGGGVRGAKPGRPT